MAKDFRNKTFQKVLRGYSPDEVDEYIARINEEYRKTERKMNDAERKLALALEKLDEVSEKYAALAEDNAVYEDRARSVIAEANNKADRIVSEARESAKEIEKKAEKEKHAVSKLYEEITSFRDRVFEIYNTHIESFEEIMDSAEEFAFLSNDGSDSESADERLQTTVYDDSDEGNISGISRESENEKFAEDAGTADRAESKGEIKSIKAAEAHDINKIRKGENSSAEYTEENNDNNTSSADEARCERDGCGAATDYVEKTAEHENETDSSQEGIFVKNMPCIENDDGGSGRGIDSDDVIVEQDILDNLELARYLEKIDRDDEDDDGEESILDWSRMDEAENTPDEKDDPAKLDFGDISDGFSFEDYSIDGELKKDEGHRGAESSSENDCESRMPDGDIDSIFEDGNKKRNMSLTDEFDIVFGSDSSTKNVNEILCQPTISPEEPPRPHKHR